jgi:plastocyanin domain-containing protein
MLRVAALALIFLGTACTKESQGDKPKDKPAEQKPAQEKDKPAPGGAKADAARKVAIEVNKKGYVPEEVVGKPNEKLVLVFTRTVKGACLEQLKTPDGKLVQLPMNEAVEVPVTVPASGEVKFACGMEMFFGKIIAKS